MELKFGDVFKRAWKITGRFKSLSVLSFFRQEGLFAILAVFILFPPLLSVFFEPLVKLVAKSSSSLAYPSSDAIASFVLSLLGILAIVLVIFGVIWLVSWIVSIFAYGGLIKETEVADRGEIASAKSGWKAGGKYFWRVLGLTFVLALPLSIISQIYSYFTSFSYISWLPQYLESLSQGSISGASESALVGNMMGYYGLSAVYSIIVLVLSVFLGILLKYALRAGVLEDLTFGKAISRGWQLFKNNIGHSLLAYLIEYAVAMAVIIAASIIITVIIVVAIIAGGASLSGLPDPASLTQALSMAQPLLWIIFVAVLLSMIIFSFGLAIYGTFSESFWTIIYRHITGRSLAEAQQVVAASPSAPVTEVPAPPTTPTETEQAPGEVTSE